MVLPREGCAMEDGGREHPLSPRRQLSFFSGDAEVY